jgi:hypothetical protein
VTDDGVIRRSQLKDPTWFGEHKSEVFKAASEGRIVPDDWQPPDAPASSLPPPASSEDDLRALSDVRKRIKTLRALGYTVDVEGPEPQIITRPPEPYFRQEDLASAEFFQAHRAEILDAVRHGRIIRRAGK